MKTKKMFAMMLTVMLITELLPLAAFADDGDTAKSSKLKIKVVDLQPTYAPLSCPFDISGRILDENNEPVGNKDLKVFFQGNSSNFSEVGGAKTDADGYFSMDIIRELPSSECERKIKIEVPEDTDKYEYLSYYAGISFGDKTPTSIDDQYLGLKPIYPNETFTGDLVVKDDNKKIGYGDVLNNVFLRKEGTNVGSTTVVAGGTEVKIEVSGSDLGVGKHVLTFGYSGNDTFASCSHDFVLNVLPMDCQVSVSADPQGGGTVTGGGTYGWGSKVTVTATANTDYDFLGWYDGDQCVSDDETYTISKLEKNTNLVARFKKSQKPSYMIDASVAPGQSSWGSVSGGGNYQKDMQATVTASPASGCRFVKWTEGGSTVSTSASYTFTVTAERNLVAHFEAIPITTYKVGGGTPLAKATVKNKSMTVIWNKIQGAEGYDIFFATCNHSEKKKACKNVKTIKGNKTFKWTKSGLKKGTAYKFYVRAYVMKNGKKTYISNSPLMHAYTGNGTRKYTNAKSVSVNKTKVSLKAGKTFKINAKVNKMKKNKKLMPKSHAPTLRYMTSDKKIATVSKKGKITAKGKGTCTVYVYAHNGVSKAIKVVVK